MTAVKVGIRIPKRLGISPKIGPPSLPDPVKLFDHTINYDPETSKRIWFAPATGRFSIEKTNVSVLKIAGVPQQVVGDIIDVNFSDYIIFIVEKANPLLPASIRLTINQNLITPDIMSFETKPVDQGSGRYMLVVTNDTAATSVISNRRFYLYDTDLLTLDNWNAGTYSYIVNPLIREIDVPVRANGTLYTVQRGFWYDNHFYLFATRPGNYSIIYIIRYNPVDDRWSDLDDVDNLWTRFDLPALGANPAYVPELSALHNWRYWHLNSVTGEFIGYNVTANNENRNITVINLKTKEINSYAMSDTDGGTPIPNQDIWNFTSTNGIRASEEAWQGPVVQAGIVPYKRVFRRQTRINRVGIHAFDDERGLYYFQSWTDRNLPSGAAATLFAANLKDDSIAFSISNGNTVALSLAPTVFFKDIGVVVQFGTSTTSYRWVQFNIDTLQTNLLAVTEANGTNIPTTSSNQGSDITVNYRNRFLASKITGTVFRVLMYHSPAFGTRGITHLDFGAVATDVIDIVNSNIQF